MIAEQNRTIGDVTFHVRQLPFTKARATLVLLSKKVAPGLGALLESMPRKGESLLDKDAGQLGDALSKLLDPLSDADLEHLAEVFGDATCFQRVGSTDRPVLNKANRQALFTGRLVLFFQWLAYCVEVNYSDFFALLPEAPAPGSPGAEKAE